jgi:Tol biopolymer transport system component
MNKPHPGSMEPLPSGKQVDRLDSWKKIAAYLKRDVSTVQRWERREAMPVHRHLHDKLGSVYAFRSELDVWWESRSLRLLNEEGGAAPPAARESARLPPAHRSRSVRLGIVTAILLALGAFAWFVGKADLFWRDHLVQAQFRPLTEFEGMEHAAAISRDGAAVAFLADRDGQMDAWVTHVDRGDFRNLTRGSVQELVNPSIRTLGFSPDSSVVAIWTRQSDGSRPEDINIWAAPLTGGSLQPYLKQAAEFDWSHDGKRLVYHTTAPGDPIFVKSTGESTARQIFAASVGVHCHFPLWSADDAYIYFVQGVPPDEWDIWRINSTGGAPERLTYHAARVTYPVLLNRRTLLYLSTDSSGGGPWLYALDLSKRVPHRVSSGMERYTSLAASADGTRLAATVANHKASLWRVPISEEAVSESAAVRIATPTGYARSPRVGPGFIAFVSSRSGREGVWKLDRGNAAELWSAPHARVIGAPAIAPDGRIAFSVEERGQTRLYVMNEEGRDARVVADSLQLRGGPAWAPGGESLLAAAAVDGAPRLMKIPLHGGPATPLVTEYSTDPVWSPDGQFLVYSGPDVGTTFPLRAAAPDGRPRALRSLLLTRGPRRVGFVHGPRAVVILRGAIDHKNFWLVDLETGAERQLTSFARDFDVRDFDVSSDGREIVFDRMQENSDVVLIDLARR